MNWAKDRAVELLKDISEKDPNLTLQRRRVKVISAALQRVADECAHETAVANQLGLRPYDAIRARFLKEEV